MVNKRIAQRFFVKDTEYDLSNPPSGCIVDSELVESSGDKFDFYLFAAETRQGCALPVHFFVPLNNSSLTPEDLKQLTFLLCHFYFNYGGAIKVPAPCQYAHKIAEFFKDIKITKQSKV